MLDIQYIRDNVNEVKKSTKDKNLDPELVDKLLKLDTKRLTLLRDIEDLRAQRNVAAKKRDIETGKKVKNKLQKLEPSYAEIDEKYNKVLWKIPNLVSDDTPIGKDENENKVLRKWGKPTDFKFRIKDHLKLGNALDIIDTETA